MPKRPPLGPMLHPKAPLETALKEQGEDTKRSRALRDEKGLVARTTARLGSKYAELYKGVAASGPMKKEKTLKVPKGQLSDAEED